MPKSSFKILSDTNHSEKIRIKSNEIEMNLQVFKGKSQGSFVFYAPFVEFSGYGKSAKEALESFQLSLELFSEEILALKKEVQKIHLQKMGWKQEKIKTKNFSKAFIDANGVLQNFDLGSKVELSHMELSV